MDVRLLLGAHAHINTHPPKCTYPSNGGAPTHPYIRTHTHTQTYGQAFDTFRSAAREHAVRKGRVQMEEAANPPPSEEGGGGAGGCWDVTYTVRASLPFLLLSTKP